MYDNFIVEESILSDIKNIGDINSNIEMCGIITGSNINNKTAIAEKIFNIPNIAYVNKSVHYLMEPKQMFNIFKKTNILDKQSKISFLSVWHTHPNCEPIPSSIDLSLAHYDVIYLIYSPLKKLFRAWKLNKNKDGFNEIEINKV